MLELKNNAYEIGGLDADGLAKRFGTPVFVYDGGKIESQYWRLKNAFSGVRVRLQYACKANSNLNLMRFVRRLGAGLDAVSIQEVELGLLAGFMPEDIIFTPNSVSFEEICAAVELGVRINIDNISILERFGHRYGSGVPVCIRINPHILAGAHVKLQTGHIDSKFGISIFQLRHIQRVVSANGIRVEGLHMHTGSELADWQVFMQGVEVILGAAAEFDDLSYIDFGSGFKIAYRETDPVTDLEALGAAMTERMRAFEQETGKSVEIWFEPGKFLVAESGTLLVQCNALKQTVSTTFVGVDSGLNHLIRPMFYNAWHPIANVSNPQGTPRVYSVVGYICETDTFGWDRKINEVREGDVLAIDIAGAYGYSMSSNYNCRFRPPEVFVYQGKAHLIRRRETMDDALRTLVELQDWV